MINTEGVLALVIELVIASSNQAKDKQKTDASIHFQHCTDPRVQNKQRRTKSPRIVIR